MSDELLTEIANYLTRQFLWPSTGVMPKDACLSEAKEILAKVTEELKEEIDIKRDYAFGESLFGSREHQREMSAMVGAYDLVLNLIKEITK